MQDFAAISKRDLREMRRMAIDILAIARKYMTPTEVKNDKRCQNARYILAMFQFRSGQ